MSTNDVPGFKPEHHDELAMGCWAEHADDSLLLVESVEGGYVVYSMFDFADGPILEYRDKMAQGAFEKAFSYDPDKDDDDLNVLWIWHDKTPFPWDRIIDKGARPGLRFARGEDYETVAERIARHRKLHAHKFDYQSAVSKAGSATRAIKDKIQRAIGELRS